MFFFFSEVVFVVFSGFVRCFSSLSCCLLFFLKKLKKVVCVLFLFSLFFYVFDVYFCYMLIYISVFYNHPHFQILMVLSAHPLNKHPSPLVKA